MIVREHVPLRSLTTLKVGGDARYVLEIESLEDLAEAVTFARERSVPFVPLGQGSNVLASDDGYRGAVLLMRIGGTSFEEQGGSVRATAGAGVSWDEFVRACAAHGLWGVENLAGIPGTVGAAPVQNIGAYGTEVKQAIAEVEAFDATTGERLMLPADACAFEYRDSRFKREPNLIITRVSFALTKEGAAQAQYADLTAAAAAGEDLSTPGAVGEVVRRIRARKFPDLAEYGTAGSFFKNPVVAPEKADELANRLGDIPRYAGATGVKVPLAFVLDRALNLRGHRLGRAFLFERQPLVLVADDDASAQDVEALAQDVAARVHAMTGIEIEREVRALDAHEWS